MTGHRSTALVIGAMGIAAGGSIMGLTWHTGGDHNDDLDWFGLGAMLVLIGLFVIGVTFVWHIICKRFAPWDDTWEMASDAGYNRGYREGRRVGRPIVMRLDRKRDDSVEC